MVLQNASDSAGQDTFQDSAPSSDNDPYENATFNSNSGQQDIASIYKIDTSKLPKPLPLIGPLAGFNENLLSTALTQKIAGSSQLLQRPLSQEEVDAFAYWTAKQISILSYGVPFGVGGGLWRCWSTADTFRMPFYKQNPETFNPQAFPPKMAILKGNNAVMAWHTLRAVLYGGIGNVLGQIFFGSYSMSVGTVGELTDKRLKAFIDAAKAQAAKQRGSLPSTPKAPGMGQQPHPGAQSQGDASPGTMPMADQSPETSWEDMSRKKQPEVQAQPKRWPQARPAPVPPPVEESSDQPFGIFDDASPTGGQGVQADIRAAPVTSQGGSAWDRIRQQQQPVGRRSPQSTDSTQGQNTWSRVQKDSAANNDGYSYTKTEDGDLAKGEAQQDFDARVERERRGGDFAKGSGDQKRW